jgi:hypothetical protein
VKADTRGLVSFCSTTGGRKLRHKKSKKATINDTIKDRIENMDKLIYGPLQAKGDEILCGHLFDSTLQSRIYTVRGSSNDKTSQTHPLPRDDHGSE